MKVLMINGSPRTNGNTSIALGEMKKVFEEEGINAEIVQVGNKAVRGCIACNRCAELGKCVFDDVVNELAPKFEEADGLVIASPVYYASASGEIMMFLDRFFGAFGADMRYKPGSAVASARRGGTTSTIDDLNKYFQINQMPVVSSNYWNIVHGNTPEEVVKDEEGMQTMRLLGKNMAWLVKSIDAAKKQGIDIPCGEDKIKTNFIR